MKVSSSHPMAVFVPLIQDNSNGSAITNPMRAGTVDSLELDTEFPDLLSDYTEQSAPEAEQDGDRPNFSQPTPNPEAEDNTVKISAENSSQPSPDSEVDFAIITSKRNSIVEPRIVANAEPAIEFKDNAPADKQIVLDVNMGDAPLVEPVEQPDYSAKGLPTTEQANTSEPPIGLPFDTIGISVNPAELPNNDKYPPLQDGKDELARPVRDTSLPPDMKDVVTAQVGKALSQPDMKDLLSDQVRKALPQADVRDVVSDQVRKALPQADVKDVVSDQVRKALPQPDVKDVVSAQVQKVLPQPDMNVEASAQVGKTVHLPVTEEAVTARTRHKMASPSNQNQVASQQSRVAALPDPLNTISMPTPQPPANKISLPVTMTKANIAALRELPTGVHERPAIAQAGLEAQVAKQAVSNRVPPVQTYGPSPLQSNQASTIITAGTSQIPVFTTIAPHNIAHAIIKAAGQQTQPNTTSSLTSDVPTAAITRPAKSLELQLVPRSLGVIDIKIVNHNGQMNIVMLTNTVEAEQLLRTEAGQLREAIRSAGHMIEDVRITIQQQPGADNGFSRDARSNDSQLMHPGYNKEQGAAPENGSFTDRSSEREKGASRDDFPEEEFAERQVRDGVYY